MAKSLKAILNLALLTLLAALLEGCETATPEERQSSTTWILVFATIFLIGFLFILSTSLVYDQLENGRPTAILGLLISCGCLIPSLALWIAYVGQRETLESIPEQWQADGAILLTFAIGCTLVFIFASLSLGHLAMIADAKNKTALMPWVLMHGVFCMLSLAATFSLWISVAGHEAGTTCTKLQELSPTFCAEQSLGWISPAPDGFSASECCHQLLSSTMTTTVTQTTTRTLPSRRALPCLCNASAAELLCETGTGQVCSLLDTEERTEACFAAGTLCTPATSCRTRASLSADCSRFLEESDCSRQAACIWEDAEVTYAYQCWPTESRDAISVGLCAGYLSKSSCNEQIICKWQLLPLGEERCSNGGTWRGCTSGIPSLDHLCSEFKTSPDCATDRFCQWSATCDCADDFFGDLCEKQVAPFSSRSGCTAPVRPGEMCRAIVYAASALDQFRCASTGLDVACSDWLRLKETVEVMYEAELGGTVVDFLAFFLGLAISFSIHKMSNFYGYRRFALLALVVSFLADLTLEAILSSSVSAAASVLDRFKDCASQETNGDSSFTKMKGTADWIRVLAFANIIIASIGLCSDIAAAALDWSRDPAIKAGLLLVTHGAGGLEAVIGLFSWRLNTEPLIEELQAVELAALGLEELERGRGKMCFTRHPDLPGPELVSMDWSNPIIYILLPGGLTLFSLSLALVLAFCVPRSAREVLEMELLTGRGQVRPAPVVEFEKPTPPGKPRQTEAVAPKGQAPPPLNPAKTVPDKPRRPEAVAPKGQAPPPLNLAKTVPDKPRQPEAVAPKGQAPPPLNLAKTVPDKPRQPEAVAPAEEAPPPLNQPEAVAPMGEAPPPLNQPEAVAPTAEAPPPLNQPEAVAPKVEAPPPLNPARTATDTM